MSRFVCFLIIAISTGVFSDASAQPWKLILYEEFDGNTLNFEKWGVGYWWSGGMIFMEKNNKKFIYL